MIKRSKLYISFCEDFGFWPHFAPMPHMGKVLKIRSIRSNLVNFFWLVIRFRSGSGPVPAKMIPIQSGSGSVRIFNPVTHCPNHTKQSM